jgi:LysM repeat protein
MAKKKTTKKKETKSTLTGDAKKLQSVLKSVGIKVSDSQMKSAIKTTQSGGGGSSSSNRTVTVPTPAPTPTPVASSGSNYTIKSGDTLSAIAARNNTTVSALATANGIANPNLIQAGATLKIPSSGGGSPAPTSPTPTTNTQNTSGAGMSQTQFVDMLANQGIITDKNKAYQTLGITTPEVPVVPPTVVPPPTKPEDESNPLLQNLPPNFKSWPPEMQAYFLETGRYQGMMLENGKVVNPNIELSPSVIKKFVDQATTEIDPAYKEKFSLLDNEFTTSIDRMMTDYNKEMGRVDTSFKKTLGEQAQSEAESGTAFSSGRQDRETQAVDKQNQIMGDFTTSVQRTAQDNALKYEEAAGSDRLRSLNIPGLTSYNASNQGVSQGASRSLYAPLGNIALGSINKTREVDLAQRSKELEGDYRKSRILDYSSLSA